MLQESRDILGKSQTGRLKFGMSSLRIEMFK